MSGAARQARYRRRQRRGLAVVHVEAELHALVAVLIAEGFLDDRSALDFPAVERATAALLQETVTRYSEGAEFPGRFGESNT